MQNKLSRRKVASICQQTLTGWSVNVYVIVNDVVAVLQHH